MMRVLLFFLLLSSTAWAQPYKDGKKTRHRFAQSSIGLDLYHAWGGTILLPLNDSQKVSTAINEALNPRVHLGGLHFWGHVEFYFNINLPALRLSKEPLRVKQSQGDIFGIKIFPRAVAFGKLNFYMGTSLASSSFRVKNTQSGQRTATYNLVNLPVSAGLFYFKKKWGCDISFTYVFNSALTYHYSKQNTITINQPNLLVNFGVRKLFETTASAEKNYQNGRTDSVYRALKKEKKLSSFYFGGGPSSAFYLKEPQNNSNTFSFIGYGLVSIFPEINFGYFYQPARLHTTLVLRQATLKKSVFDVSQKFTRLACGIESHVMLCDYHGFVPFLGAHLSYETLTYSENNNGSTYSAGFRGFKPGLVLGWDILPDKLQYFTLRTNLRYFPALDVKLKNGKKISLDQVEFNFIEFIYYPTRKKNILRASAA